MHHWKDGATERLRPALIRYGPFGFCVRLVLLIRVALLRGDVFQIIGSRAAPGHRRGFPGLALPVFTTFWCRRYASLGRAMADPARGPSPDRVRGSAWIRGRAAQFVIGNIVTPRTAGRTLNPNLVGIRFSLFFRGMLWGITGMFLAIPLTVIPGILAARFDETRRFAVPLWQSGPVDADNGSPRPDDGL